MNNLQLKRLEKQRWDRRLKSFGKRRRRRMYLQSEQRLFLWRETHRKTPPPPSPKLASPFTTSEKKSLKPTWASRALKFVKGLFSQRRGRD